MGILFELAVIVGVVWIVGRVVPPWLRERARLRGEREAHERKLALMQKTDDVVSVMLADKELARDVFAKLGKELGEVKGGEGGGGTPAAKDQPGDGDGNGKK